MGSARRWSHRRHAIRVDRSRRRPSSPESVSPTGPEDPWRPRPPSTTRCVARSSSPRPPASRWSPTPAASAACCSPTTARPSPRATTAAPAPPTPRPTRWPAPASAARGTTAVVTLEPCNHTGRTGPCTEALVAAGVRRVVYAEADANPVAAGGRRGPRGRRHRGRGGPARRRGRRARRRLPPRPARAAPLRDLEVRRHPRRPQRRGRRHLAVGLLDRRAPRHPPPACAVRHDARRHGHGPGRRPAAHRARRRTTGRWRSSRCAR